VTACNLVNVDRALPTLAVLCSVNYLINLVRLQLQGFALDGSPFRCSLVGGLTVTVYSGPVCIAYFLVDTLPEASLAAAPHLFIAKLFLELLLLEYLHLLLLVHA